MNRRARDRRAWIALTVLEMALATGLTLPAAAGFGEIGWNDFRVSYGDPESDDQAVAVAYSPEHDVYLVVWREQLSHPNDPNPRRIVARRLEGSTGRPLGDEIEVLELPDCTGPFCPSNPAVAYSPTAERFIVAVALDAITIGQVQDEFEIFAWDVDPETGAASWFQILSGVGGLGDPDFDAFDPALACSTDTTECLVAWWGDDNVGGLVQDETEIFGQRFDAATGDPVGSDDFRISDTGPALSTAYGALFPAVAYNSDGDEYLVVWSGDDNVGGLVDGESEIFGQRLNAATGTALGANDFRISDMGGTGNPAFDASQAAVAYSALHDEYLVVWAGDDDTGGLVDEEGEIFVQRLDAATGVEEGTNDLRVSDLGGTGNASFSAGFPAVAYDAALQQYFVVWHGDDDAGGMQDGESEIFGQRLAAATAAEVGANDLRLSDLGGTGSNPYDALFPAVAYGSAGAQVLVLWDGTDDVGGLAEGEREILAQRLGEQVVFADGFESGDTAAWSLTLP